MGKIESKLGLRQGKGITFRATGYNPTTKELTIHVEEIINPRWHKYLDENKTYTLFYHENSSPDSKFDPLELWELPTNQKKWVNEEHVAIPEYDLVLPQVLLYFWHNDDKLDLDWDF
jgi:hypothetical protein